MLKRPWFRALCTIFLTGFLLSVQGCAPSFQGIKMRAQTPSIDEALKSVTLALTVDGYTIEKIDMGEFVLETGWRELKENERSAAEIPVSAGNATARITVKMARRGSLYDVFVTPWVRTVDGGKERMEIAPPVHPLRVKWEKAITRLIQREARDED